MSGEPFVLELVRIRQSSDGKVVYQAVDERTASSILDTQAAYTHLDRPDIQFTAESLGSVQVYVPDWMARALREENGV